MNDQESLRVSAMQFAVDICPRQGAKRNQAEIASERAFDYQEVIRAARDILAFLQGGVQ